MLVPIFLPKDTPVDIHIKELGTLDITKTIVHEIVSESLGMRKVCAKLVPKALVGYPNSVQFHVFEITRQLPQFAMYALKPSNEQAAPEGFVRFKVNERLQRICMWINQNFLFPTDIEFESGPNLTLNLKCLRTGSSLAMVFEISGKVTFHTTSMSLAADLIQSMASYLNIDTLESKASFPKEEENLSLLMEKLNSIEEARLKLGTDVADQLEQIRNLIVMAEDRICDL
ncbi:hypothetical protein NQ318_010006 [Aromia moschata]|uniref:Uncharacterized protein n=1 Tax=Aromia moschata TaxID=1265417 RepID=A0AAV8Y8P5_9CUCU|nr:hypothetical protein NQ318_010006 [Aromia moschata]